MNVKFIKEDPQKQIDLSKLKYINELEKNRAYYLPLIGGELEWEFGKIITYDEAFKGRSFFETGQIYIWVVRHIFRLIDVTLFDLGTFLEIHDLLNIEDLSLLKIHINNAFIKKSDADKKNNNKKVKDLKKRIDEFIFFLTKQPTTITQPQLEQNKYHKIFSDDLGYTLFNEWHKQHKTETKLLANFSFIYIALDKDSLVVCNQPDYIEFLSQLDPPIIIDKVDSRQQGNDNKKYKLYEANKKRLKG